MSIWVKECAGGPARNEIEVRGGGFNLSASNKLLYEGNFEASNEADLIVYKYYFPGWHVEVDGKDSLLDYRFSKQGIFKTKVQTGKHSIKIYYAKTLIMRLADMISLTAFGMFLFILLRSLKRDTKK